MIKQIYTQQTYGANSHWHDVMVAIP
jgi:hypothetical protein